MRWLFNFIAIVALAVSLFCMGDMVGKYYGTPYLQKTVEKAGAATDSALSYGLSGCKSMRSIMNELMKKFENFTEFDKKLHKITTGEKS